MNPRTGAVKKSGSKWQVRVTWKDPVSGVRRDRRKIVPTKGEAIRLRDAWLEELEDSGDRTPDERRNFFDLADYYVENEAIPARYEGGRKVAGLRSWKLNREYCAIWRKVFGQRALRSIRYEEIRQARLDRFDAPIRVKTRDGWKDTGRRRTITTVNREMTNLRTLFAIAVRKRWIKRSPFADADKPLISVADEKARDRVLTIDEERSLLAQCVGPRAHLLPFVIAALDTGMRQGELRQLRRRNVDLKRGHLTIPERHTKTQQERSVEMSTRLRQHVEQLLSAAPPDPDHRVFGFVTTVKRSFQTAMRLAGITDLQFRDLRTTAGTRLLEQGLSVAQVALILGHRDTRTTMRYYLRLQDSTRSQAARAMDRVQRQKAADVSRSAPRKRQENHVN